MKRTIVLLAISALLIAVSGCTGDNVSEIRSENNELRAELKLLTEEVQLLRREVNIAIAASTNSLRISQSHSELIENINTQLDTISDAMTSALNTEINREKATLLR